MRASYLIEWAYQEEKKLGKSFVGLGLVSGSKQVAKKFGTEKANLDDEIAETQID